MLLCVCCHRRCQELAEPVEVSDGMQMKLDPVAACRIVPDNIDHARRLKMGYLAVAGEQRGLVAVARRPFLSRASREHCGDEPIPQHIALIVGHVRDRIQPCWRADHACGLRCCRGSGGHGLRPQFAAGIQLLQGAER